MTHRHKIATLVTGLAEYYNKTLTAGQIEMYVEDLISLSPEELHTAVRDYRRRPENKWFPLPAELIGLVRPDVSPEQNAIDAVSRIVESVSKFGPYRTVDAKSNIGELGWKVVQRDGGWINVCQNLTEDNLGTTRAQWREMAKSISARAHAGVLDSAPEIPKSVYSKLGVDPQKLLKTLEDHYE